MTKRVSGLRTVRGKNRLNRLLAKGRPYSAAVNVRTRSRPESMAEREGFEPPVPRRAQQISSLPRSTTPASLRGPNEARILSGARDPLLPVHVLAQGARHGDRPVRVLAVLENRDQGAPDGEAQAVERRHQLGRA